MLIVMVKHCVVLFFIIYSKIFIHGFPQTLDLREMSGFSLNEYHSRSHMMGAQPQVQAKIFRLPDNLSPVSYDLKMMPNLDDFTFFGQVNISLVVVKSTKNILMHSYNLEITSLEVYRETQRLASNFTLLPDDQMLSISCQRRLPRNNSVEVRIKFKGILNDQMVGFYRSSYRVGNVTKWLATTQFEQIYARRAFPCFDEPKFRATYQITIARHQYQHVLSNMPLKFTSLKDPSIDNRVWDSFEKTPPMPSYLVAFIVSEFKYRADSQNQTRVWSRENAIEDTSHALAQARPLLKILENFLQVPYNLPKMDVVAIPDFLHAAMENWGLTTFGEKFLLWNEKSNTETRKSLITSVISHEFSHQWFGDLVTIAWWDYFWLKEGFATYFEYFSTAMKETNWRYDQQFVVEVLHFALKVDGITAYSPMTAQIRSTSDMNWDFIFASYEKAGSVIRMIEHVVSPITFKNALNLYLVSRINAGGVADPSHLYDAFEKQMQKEGKFLPRGITITSVFKKFAEQIGYPCITVSRRRNGLNFDIELKQHPYTSVNSKKLPERMWFVPLSCTKQSEINFYDTKPTIWLTNTSKITLPNEVRDDEWYICNIQQTGYYRVNYDIRNWQLLINQLHSSPLKIHSLNRAQLIDDYFAFLNDGYLPFTLFFDLLGYLEFEVDPIPWYTSLRKFFEWNQLLEDTDIFPEFKHFSKHVIGHYYNYVGFYEKPTDCHLTKRIRASLTFVASYLEIEDVVVKSNKEFAEKLDLKEIPPNVRETVLCTAIRTTQNITVWNRLWDFYRKSDTEEEKVVVLMSFGCASTDLLKKFIFKLVDEKDTDIPKKFEIRAYISTHRFQKGITASLDFILDMIPQLGNYTRAYDVVMRLLYNMDLRVQSKEQIHLLGRIIEESKKLDQQKYGLIAYVSNYTREKGEIKMKQNDEISAKLSAAFGNRETTTIPSVASFILPSVITLLSNLFIAAICW